MKRNAISPVVAAALLMVVAVVAVTGFQSWFADYSSEMLSDVEIKSNNADSGILTIEALIGNELYLINNIEDELDIVELKVGDNVCANADNLSLGISYVNVSDCIINLTTATPNVILITTKEFLSKKFLSRTLFYYKVVSLSMQREFSGSVWKTDNAGDTNDNQIKLPLESDGDYNFTVFWGDGTNNTITEWDDLNVTHTYPVAGTYEVNITGTIQGFRFNGAGDRLKILEITEWGPLNVGNNGAYFRMCENLDVTAEDALDLTGTTNLYMMFGSDGMDRKYG
jgi:flagellin-like protein